MYDSTFAKSMCIREKKQIYANILAIVFLSVKYSLLYFFILNLFIFIEGYILVKMCTFFCWKD